LNQECRLVHPLETIQKKITEAEIKEGEKNL